MPDNTNKPTGNDPTDSDAGQPDAERTVDPTIYLDEDQLEAERTVDPTTYLDEETSVAGTAAQGATVVRGDDTTPGAGFVPSAAAGVPRDLLIKDRFVLEKRLGKGGMGEVYRARDLRKEEAEDDDPYVAIKFLGESFSRHPRALIALQREAKKSQQLAHPNVVTVFDFDRDGDRVYMTMEYMQGSALGGWRSIAFEAGREPGPAELVEQMAAGLAYAHGHGVVHSDLKPDNVFVTTDGRVKILDFGIARIMDNALARDSFDAGELGALTQRYASLEMLQGGHEPHPADDIYALGLMAYQLFADGAHPYRGETAEQALADNLVPEPLQGVERRQWRAIRRAIELRREDRTQSAEAFIREFSGAGRRNRLLLGVVGVLAAVSIVLGVMVTQRVDGPAVPFDELPLEQQQAIAENLELGNRSADIQDWDGASRYYLAAYDLHPRNPDAEAGLDRLVQSLVSSAASMNNARQRGYLKKLVDDYSSNEYLANHPDMQALRAQLAEGATTP